MFSMFFLVPGNLFLLFKSSEKIQSKFPFASENSRRWPSFLCIYMSMYSASYKNVSFTCLSSFWINYWKVFPEFFPALVLLFGRVLRLSGRSGQRQVAQIWPMGHEITLWEVLGKSSLRKRTGQSAMGRSLSDRVLERLCLCLCACANH